MCVCIYMYMSVRVCTYIHNTAVDPWAWVRQAGKASRKDQLPVQNLLTWVALYERPLHHPTLWAIELKKKTKLKDKIQFHHFYI